jgi:peptidoglycan hydrolase-like protein with peptidoglycan-binding domain
LGTASRTLSLGDRGPDVRAVHAFLFQFGYFENADLRSRYPDWVPVVRESPTEPDVFGPATTQAVRAYQRLNGLAETGRVDTLTIEAMKSRFCGVPDSDPAAEDSRRKFDPFFGSPWTKSALTFEVATLSLSGVTQAQAEAAFANAFATWASVIPLTFTKVASGADIKITARNIDGRPVSNNTLAQASWANHPLLELDTSEFWSVTNPATGVDVESVALHEIGHKLGLAHSSIGGAAMAANLAGPRRALSNDDVIGVTSRYPVWETLPGLARDIGVGANGAAWIIGSNPSGAGFSIHRFNGSGWTLVPGGAVRVAVEPSGNAWVVDSNFTIFRFNGSGWTHIPGAARDIGIGANGTVWIIGQDAVPGGFSIHRRDGSVWTKVPGGASRIAVGPTGTPWIVNPAGNIFRLNPNNTWQLLPGLARDIGVGPDGTAYCIGLDSVPGGSSLHVFVEQGPASGTTERRDWSGVVPAGLTSVSVGPNGLPWGTNVNLNIYRQDRR